MVDAHLTPRQALAFGLPLPAECDVVVVIAWLRMGTPLVHDAEAYLSVTHFEVESAIRAVHPPRMLVYRWTAPPDQAWEDFATGETVEQRQQQLGAVEQFVAGVTSAAIQITPFASIAEFETLFSAQFTDALAQALKPAPTASASTTAADAGTTPPIIFLSAVSDEFRSYRAQLKGDLERAAQVPSIIQEYFDAVGQGTLGGLDARIRRCSAVVHLIGDMAGHFPPPNAVRELAARNPTLTMLLGLDIDALLEPANAISYTQWEAYLAILHGKQLFIAEAARDAKREPDSYRRDPALLASQQAHRERLRRLMDRWHELIFDGPDDIASKLLPALAAQNQQHFSGASIYSLGARQFDDYYLKGRTLDGKEVPAPFGGRQREMAHLDRWLDDPTRDHRLLVSSPAGRGKSALLAKWMQALRDAKRVGPDGWQLVFVPISNRFQTNRATTYLELLTRQLSQVAREHVIPPAVDPEQFYRNTANRLISGLATAGTRTLLVFDGLDEALGEERLANLLPATLPPTFKVLASARWLAEDRESSGWLTRLGWISASRSANHDLVVGKLDVDAVANVLTEMDAPIDAVGRDRALVNRLTELTEGEPLLLRFYAEDLWLKTIARSPITLDVLNGMKPGFGPYFKTWLQDQGGVASDLGAHVDLRTTDAALAILGFAKGALTGKDLLGVAAAGFPTLLWRLIAKPHIAPFRRFVIGDGSYEFPYVFSHPKVAEFIRTDTCKELADPTAIAFFAWGRAHLAALNSGQLRPEQASRYALDHYVDHLEDVCGTATAEHYLEMVEDGWRRAKERHDGGPAGFASDVRAASAACRRDGPIAHLGAQWRCALTLSSIKSLGTNIPGPLLVELVSDGALSAQQACHYCELKGPIEEAVSALAVIATRMAADGQQSAAELATASIDLAASAPNVETSATCFARALEILEPMASTFGAKSASSSVSLDASKRQSILSRILQTVASTSDDRSQAVALAALVPHLKPDQRAPAVVKAFQAAIDAIEAMAAYYLRNSERIFGEFDLAESMRQNTEAAWVGVLTALAPYLDSEQRTVALNVATSIRHDSSRFDLLSAFARYLDVEALEAKIAAGGELFQPHGLATLAVQLPATRREALLGEALQAATSIPTVYRRSVALAALLPRLRPSKQRVAVKEVLSAIASAGREGDFIRCKMAAELASYLDDDQLTEMLGLATEISDEDWRCEALVALAPRLDPAVRDSVIAAALQAAVE
ncbi:MAG: NACHT domain-containing protein, partial [Proteobacteria bacterium]|nr:NACHT domain-containing protein [Pseudomonadota bacterium]